MKKLKNILNEGILASIDDNIKQGEKNANMLDIKKFFDVERIRKNPSAGLIKVNGLYFSPFKNDSDPLGKFISKFCSYDGEVLTINLDASKTFGYKFNVTVVLGLDLPIIKFIDTATAKRIKSFKSNHYNAEYCSALNIVALSNDKISLKDYFHPSSYVSMLYLSPRGYEISLSEFDDKLECPILNDTIPFKCEHIIYHVAGNTNTVDNVINKLPSNCTLYIDDDTIKRTFERDHNLPRYTDHLGEHYYIYKN